MSFAVFNRRESPPNLLHSGFKGRQLPPADLLGVPSPAPECILPAVAVPTIAANA